MTDLDSLWLALERGLTGAEPSEDVSLVLLAEQRPTIEQLEELRAAVASSSARTRSLPALDLPADDDAQIWAMEQSLSIDSHAERRLAVVDRAIAVVTHRRFVGWPRS